MTTCAFFLGLSVLGIEVISCRQKPAGIRTHPKATAAMASFKAQLQEGWQRHRPTLKATLLASTGLASLFAVLSASDCSFMVAARYSYDSTRVGLFSQAMYDLSSTGDTSQHGTSRLGCVSYTDPHQFDGMFRAGRAFAVLTPICTLVAFLFMGCSLAFRPASTPRLWVASKATLVAATVCQMLVFLALGSKFMCSQHGCELTGVGALAVMNIILLVATSVCLCVESAPTTPWLAWWDEHLATESPEYLQHVDPQVALFIREQQDQRQRTGTDEHLTVKDSVSGQVERVRVVQQAPSPYSYDYEAGRSTADGASIPESILGSPEFRKDQRTATDEDGSDGDSTTVIGLQDLTTFRFILLSLLLFSWAITVSGVSRCSFLMVGPAGEDISHFAGIGLFSRAIYYDGQVIGCVDFSTQMKSDFDPVFVAGRSFGVITALFMTIVLISVILQAFVDRYRVELWFLVRLLLPCSTLCQLFVFFVYKSQLCNSSSQVECLPGQLGIWVIINVILMTVLCFLAFIMPPPPHPIFAVAKPQIQAHDQEQDLPETPPKVHLPVPPLYFKRKSQDKSSGRRASSSNASSVLSAEAAQHGFSLERIVKINPLKSQRRPSGSSQNPIPVPPDGAFHYNSCPSVVSSTSTLETSSPASLITVSLEYSGNQKRIVKTITHPDGSKTITTTIEELTDTSAGDSSEAHGSRAKSEALTADDTASEPDGSDSSAQGDRPSGSEMDYDDEEERLIANMIRDPPGSTAAGRFSPRRGTAEVDSEHSVKEVIVEDSSDCDRSGDANTDGSLTVETALEEKEYYSDTA